MLFLIYTGAATVRAIQYHQKCRQYHVQATATAVNVASTLYKAPASHWNMFICKSGTPQVSVRYKATHANEVHDEGGIKVTRISEEAYCTVHIRTIPVSSKTIITGEQHYTKESTSTASLKLSTTPSTELWH
eukprot:15292-Heterococcus_DN1.PRE.3